MEKREKKVTFSQFQKLGKVLMTPVMILPIAGILVGIGSAFTTKNIVALWPVLGNTYVKLFFNLLKAMGNTINSYLPIIFAVSVAIGYAEKEKGIAALSSVIGFLAMNNVMNILLGRFYTNAITGSYNQAYQWNSKCYLLLQGMLNPVIQPTLVNLSDDRERQLMAFRKMVRFICFLSFPLLFGLGLVSNEFIIITLTEKWQSSAELLRMLCVGGSVMPLYTLFSNVVISKGKSGAYFWCTVSLSVTQIVLMLLLWPYGIHLMVSVYVALTIVWMFVWYALAYRYISYRPLDFLKDTCPFLLAALGVMSLTYLATMSIANLVCLLLARVVMAAVLYFVVMKVARVAILDECIRFVLKKNR